MKTPYLILIAIFSYLFFTLSNMPAAKLLALVEANSQLPAQFIGVQGSMWNGSADKVIPRNAVAIDNFQWSLNPAKLLLLKLGGEVKGRIKGQNFIGQVSLGATGNISASDIRSRISAQVMQELIQMPLGELEGTFIIHISSLDMRAEELPQVEADIKWQSAKLTLAETVDLGHIQINIKPDEDNQLLANISNKGGQISLNGDGRVNAEKAFDIDIRFTPESSATDNIRQSLKMFARRQTDGSYLLKRKGNLNEFGI